MSNRYANKRIIHRTSGGQFRKAQMSDVGVMGVCPNCRHLLTRWYDGSQNDAHPDPRKFRNRCFTCEPMTADELAAQPKPQEFSLAKFFEATV